MEKYTEQELVRRNKLLEYEKNNVVAFKKAYGLGEINYSDDISTEFEKYSKDELHEKHVKKIVAGRLMAKRGPFLVIKDFHGTIQVYFNKKELVELADLVSKLDLGDIIWVKGEVMKTNTDAVVIKASDIELLSKSLKPLPEKYHGLVDAEERYRRRYVDLIMNDDSKDKFIKRIKITQWIKDFFNNLGYLDVETPFLHDYISGAAAKPFTTHHNSLNQEFVLRIATEIPLKKLVIGGFDRVYELGRIFRNEGYDTTHNPEFTTIEFYEAYSNVEGMMNRTEALFKELCAKLGKNVYVNNGVEIDLSKPFNRINMVDAVNKKTGKDFRNITLDEAVQTAKKFNVKLEKFFTIGHIINALYEELVECELIQPTFVYGHPIEVSPLSAKGDDPRFTERAELFINTKEYANMYTELSDPIDQLDRFKKQLDEKAAGNDEASDIDWDFIDALEYGMPPTGGCGIGIDRLVMLLTETSSIRDVLLFPTLRRLKK
ncbi:lysine--tRNA ligase [Mycoplasma sp. ES3157-GEN-MYC]|uniref:Lysine--tRNA ligase n=1 Tax=Mycoplasma miroungigenitalium TaxID=754515 RepID=A0A6M4JC58_9MOLU|nr:lysine--tRNA ligase [Mycoplasma miroungigenitalium]MBU4690512.1 lysine--tRNA ligase [Mycoplasma miroungigenitalium]MBU4691779.1 lysine--tRNA ligase [Mycoplasma miroungigenitalium]QJR43606.1 lysine--tRNA ligase [Mycoplasma miroungigenitalium]